MTGCLEIEDVNWSALVLLAGAAAVWRVIWQWAQYMRPDAPWADREDPLEGEKGPFGW